VTCQEVLDRLSPFVDNELDPVASEEVVRHLASCPECASALAREQELGASLRRELPYHGAPDLLRERLMRHLCATERRERPLGARRIAPSWRWLGAAAAIIAVASTTWIVAGLPRNAGDDAIAREAVSGHIRSLMANHLTDVTSTDQHTVKPWFAGKLDFSPPVTDFAAADYPLTGGRLDYLQGHPVAALVYMHRKHIINVFVWPVAGAQEELAPTMTERGFHVIHDTHAGMSYWVVSDLNVEELGAFARMLGAPAGKT
jgi:mycothiol system anti-sigma-R factor